MISEYIYATQGKPMLDENGLISLARKKIVRCRDCKHYIAHGSIHFDDGTTNLDACSIVRAYMVKITPDGFCAWGERKNNND